MPRSLEDLRAELLGLPRVPPELLIAYQRLCEAEKQRILLDRSLTNGLFAEQIAAYRDPARQVGILCPRRSGKTHVMVRKLTRMSLDHPGADAVVYLDVTRSIARDRVWEPVLELLGERGLQGGKENETRLTVPVRGGCPIWLRGADDRAEIRKLRGFKLGGLVMDEAASYGPAIDDPMVREVINPCLEDYGAQLVMGGTPGASQVGLFWRVTRPIDPEPEWSVHRWSLLHNTRFPRWWSPERGLDPRWREIQQEMLAGVRARNHWTEDSPAYRREWLGEWVRDDQSLVYSYDPDRNGWDGVLPEGQQLEHVMGVDLGHQDAFALVVWAYSPKLPDLWVVDEYHKSGLDVTDCAEQIRARWERYRPHSIACDTGGLGAQIVEELRRRHGIPMEAAVKTEKAAAIRLMRSDMGRGLIHVRQDSDLACQWAVLQWAPGKIGLVEDPGMHNDMADAALYGWRRSYAYTYRPDPDRPPAGSPAAIEAEAEAMLRARERAMKRDRRGRY